jgi:hypothetical protein
MINMIYLNNFTEYLEWTEYAEQSEMVSYEEYVKRKFMYTEYSMCDVFTKHQYTAYIDDTGDKNFCILRIHGVKFNYYWKYTVLNCACTENLWNEQKLQQLAELIKTTMTSLKTHTFGTI